MLHHLIIIGSFSYAYKIIMDHDGKKLTVYIGKDSVYTNLKEIYSRQKICV